MKTTYVSWLDRVNYSQALELQMSICAMKKRGYADDVLLLLEHPPTITLGRNGNWKNLIVHEEVLKARGVACFDVDRGGDITFHGPGQLVGYPILQLEKGERDVHRYMRSLEQSLIRALAGYGIEGMRDERYTGVWTCEGKIAAMGVHLSRWVTRHGFALNVNTDLSFYDLIIPCGIAGKSVTSMSAILQQSVDLKEIAERYGTEFGAVFNRDVIWLSKQALVEKLQHHANEIAVA